MLRLRGQRVAFPDRTFATVDHIVPTDGQPRPFADEMAEQMMAALERNCREFGVPLFGLGQRRPGHRPRHRPRARPHAARDDHRLRRQPHVHARGVRRRRVRHRHLAGPRRAGVAVPRHGPAEGPAHQASAARSRRACTPRTSSSPSSATLGVQGGVGFAYEYAGPVVERMTMDERMTLCNMSIEGGARAGYVNPDDTTVAYLRGPAVRARRRRVRPGRRVVAIARLRPRRRLRRRARGRRGGARARW